MDKRYQVFVSSTHVDLQEARREIMNALLELDAIPAGMELFPAADEDQWSLIKRVIDDCDYYVVIIAGRYGSSDPDGIGYTEKEYRYALEQGKPIMAFLHKDPEGLPAKHTEKSAEGRAQLAAFRSLAEQKMCKYWSTPAELGSVVSRSLVRLIKTNPGVGWVRADGLPDKDTSIELLELRTRVDELTQELVAATMEAPAGADRFAQGDDMFEMHFSFVTTDGVFLDRTVWAANFSATWNDIFSAVAPILIDEAREGAMKGALDAFVETENAASLRERKELEGRSIGQFSMREDDFQTVKVQLRALGLISKSVRHRSVKDTATYWSLTPYGDSQMVKLRAIPRASEKSSRPSRKPKGKPAPLDP